MSTPMEHQCLNDARQAVAACWQQAGAALFPIDIDLAESFAQRLAAWMITAAQAQRETEHYRALLVDLQQVPPQAGAIAEAQAQRCQDAAGPGSALDLRLRALAALGPVYAAVTTIAQHLQRQGVPTADAVENMAIRVREAIDDWQYDVTHAQTDSTDDTPILLRLVLLHTAVSDLAQRLSTDDILS